MPFQTLLQRLLGKTYFRREVLKSGFWFVDIPRTGSSSIRHNLFRAFGHTHGKASLEKSLHGKIYLPAHTPAGVARETIGPQVWDRLFTFSFVRNPYSRFSSLYHHFRYKEKSWHGSFAEFVHDLSQYSAGMSLRQKPIHAYRQVDYLTDGEGRTLVSFVGKYENRSKDLTRILLRLKLKDWDDTVRGPSLQKPQQGFRSLYSEELRHAVFEYFRADFEAFRYPRGL